MSLESVFLVQSDDTPVKFPMFQGKTKLSTFMEPVGGGMFSREYYQTKGISGKPRLLILFTAGQSLSTFLVLKCEKFVRVILSNG